MVVALAVGGIAAGWLAGRFGHTIGRGHALAKLGWRSGSVVLVPPDLRIKQAGNIALWHGRWPYLAGPALPGDRRDRTGLLTAGFTANPTLVGGRRGRVQPDHTAATEAAPS